MISDFIYLEEMEGSANSTVYMCSLPDPNLEHKDSMILCGYVHLWQDLDMDTATVKIELLDNFRDLCAGDTYQRKPFVSAVLDIIGLDTGLEFSNARIILDDFIGQVDSLPVVFETEKQEE